MSYELMFDSVLSKIEFPKCAIFYASDNALQVTIWDKTADNLYEMLTPYIGQSTSLIVTSGILKKIQGYFKIYHLHVIIFILMKNFELLLKRLLL